MVRKTTLPVAIRKFFEGLLRGSPDMRGDRGLMRSAADSLVGYMRKNPDKAPDLAYDLLSRIADLQEKTRVLEEAAITDPLTGAYNVRLYQSTIEELATSESNPQRKVTGQHFLAMVDLDGFKQINDTYGHDAGNQALIHVVKTIRQAVRKSDIVCRVGGDEFAFILKDATYEGAQEKISAVSKMFNNMSFDYNGVSVPIGATLAYGEIAPDVKRPMKDILAKIDADLYAAKAEKGDTRFPIPPAFVADKRGKNT